MPERGLKTSFVTFQVLLLQPEKIGMVMAIISETARMRLIRSSFLHALTCVEIFATRTE